MQANQTLLNIPKKYLNEKFVMWMLVQKYKIKFRTWRIIADEEQIGMVTTATRSIVQNGKMDAILLQFAFLSEVDKDKISKFEGRRSACFNLFSQPAVRVILQADSKPGMIKEEIRSCIKEEIRKRKNFWLKKAWDPASAAKVEIV